MKDGCNVKRSDGMGTLQYASRWARSCPGPTKLQQSLQATISLPGLACSIPSRICTIGARSASKSGTARPSV